MGQLYDIQVHTVPETGVSYMTDRYTHHLAAAGANYTPLLKQWSDKYMHHLKQGLKNVLGIRKYVGIILPPPSSPGKEQLLNYMTSYSGIRKCDSAIQWIVRP